MSKQSWNVILSPDNGAQVSLLPCAWVVFTPPSTHFVLWYHFLLGNFAYLLWHGQLGAVLLFYYWRYQGIECITDCTPVTMALSCDATFYLSLVFWYWASFRISIGLAIMEVWTPPKIDPSHNAPSPPFLTPCEAKAAKARGGGDNCFLILLKQPSLIEEQVSTALQHWQSINSFNVLIGQKVEYGSPLHSMSVLLL